MLHICATHCEETHHRSREDTELTDNSGGLGLTGGFVDVGNLYDCLYGIHTNQADDSILDKYDEIRREKYKTLIDPISSDNLRRLWKPADEDIKKDVFFQMVERAEHDEDFSRQMQMVFASIFRSAADMANKSRG